MASRYFIIALFILVACGEPQRRTPSRHPITDGPSGSGDRTRRNPQSLTTQQVMSLLVQAGFKQGELNIMACIARCESRFNPRALNDNGPPDDASRFDRGLFQINGVNLRACNATAEAIFDPLVNAKCAYRIRLSQGFGAWAVYRPHCTNPPIDPQKASCR